MSIINREQAEALIREQIVDTIFQEAPKQSIVMQLGRRLPNMTSKQTKVPVLDMLPMAYWVNCSATPASSRPANRRGTAYI